MMQIRQGGREKGETTCLEQTNPHINREGTAGTKPETFCLWVQMSGLTWKDKKENMLMQLEVSGIQIWRLEWRENTTKEDVLFHEFIKTSFSTSAVKEPPPPWINPSSARPAELKSVPSLRP